jgi:hypothetical protein
VETGDYRFELPKIGWTVTGTQATGNITITIAQNTLSTVKPARYGFLARLKEFVVHHPARPENHAIKYDLHEYTALTPFPALDPVP